MPSDHGFIHSSAEDLLRRRMKAELRKRMSGVRSALPTAAVAARSERVVERLFGFEPLLEAKSVALFWPMETRHEVDLRALDPWLRARGVRVAYPSIDRRARDMSFRYVARPEAMNASASGYAEPSRDDPEAAPGRLDVIVAPALAVDPRGHRIGFGGGHYDRALAVHRETVSVAVAFDFQLVPEVPDTEGDVRVGWIATDARLLQAT